MDVHESLSHTKWDCKYHGSLHSKYAVSQVVGFIKGKSAIHLGQSYGERTRTFVGQHFWARGYFVSPVGRDEQMIREYIRTKKRKISAWTSRICGADGHL
jgi:putative transposase